MPATQDTMDTRTYLDEASERFQNVYREFAAAVHQAFPVPEPSFEHGMPGFKIRITDVEKEEWRGTIDPNFLHLYMVERKSGITFHIWDPRNYYGLDEMRDELTNLGFKVMRGCIVWNRKREYPVQRMKDLIKTLAK